MENVHEGHRDRQKKKYREHGLESFTDIEALELLLYYAIPRADTNALAHALLKAFHSFRGVMEASIGELQQVPGIGANAATLLRLVTDLGIRYQRSASAPGTVIRSTRDAGRFLLPQFGFQNEECSALLSMDNGGRVIDCQILSRGTPSMVQLDARQIVEIVLRNKAARVILAHNHVTDIALPSKSDLETTRQIYRLLNSIGVKLVDHLIICDGDFVSMYESGHFAGF